MAHTNGRRRVVVTGQGVVTPLGTGVEKFWAALKKGECGIRQVQSFSTEDLYITIAGEVPDFDPKQRLQSKPLMLADKFSQYAGCAHELFTRESIFDPLNHAEFVTKLRSAVRLQVPAPDASRLKTTRQLAASLISALEQFAAPARRAPSAALLRKFDELRHSE